MSIATRRRYDRDEIKWDVEGRISEMGTSFQFQANKIVAGDVVTRFHLGTIEYGVFSSSCNLKGSKGFRKGHKEKRRKGSFAASLCFLWDLDILL